MKGKYYPGFASNVIRFHSVYIQGKFAEGKIYPLVTLEFFKMAAAYGVADFLQKQMVIVLPINFTHQLHQLQKFIAIKSNHALSY